MSKKRRTHSRILSRTSPPHTHQGRLGVSCEWRCARNPVLLGTLAGVGIRAPRKPLRGLCAGGINSLLRLPPRGKAAGSRPKLPGRRDGPWLPPDCSLAKSRLGPVFIGCSHPAVSYDAPSSSRVSRRHRLLPRPSGKPLHFKLS